MANSYKAIFSDVDGTLLDSSHRITDATKRAVRSLADYHIPFILVSARMPGAIEPLQRQLGINEPIVAYGGALVLSAADNRGERSALLDRAMRPSELEDLLHRIAPSLPAVSFSMYGADHWLVPDESDPWIVQEAAITEIRPIVWTRARLDDQSIYKMMCMGEPDDIDRLIEIVRERYPHLTSYKSKPTYLEIMASGVSKSSAIQALQIKLGVDREEVFAIGDNYNDIDMLRYAGLGVAMGNAPDEVKAYAGAVTENCDEDGLAQAIGKYFPSTG